MSDQTPIMIRPLGAVNEFHACEEIQKLAWGHGDELVVPAHMLLTIAKTGGLLLGAFDERGQMVGFVLGLLAMGEAPGAAPAGELHHHSHLLGVHPAWWGRGIGYRLKLAQRNVMADQRERHTQLYPHFAFAFQP